MFLSIITLKYVVIAIIIFGIVMYFLPIIRSKIIHLFEDIESEEYYSHFIGQRGRLLRFTLENKSNETIECDLCNLDENDGYTFSSSDGDYNKLKDYLKSFSLNVISVSVKYNHKNWQKDVVYHKTYNPFQKISKPVLVAMDNFDTIHSINDNIIISKRQFDFNAFSTLVVKLNPNEIKDVTLLITDEKSDFENNIENVKTAIVIRNNSNEKQNVDLFDEKYSNSNIDFSSIFDINSYNDIVRFFNQNPLVAKEIKIYAPNKTSINYKLNFDEVTLNQPEYLVNKDFYKIDLKDETFIARFSIEVDADSEIIISFK